MHHTRRNFILPHDVCQLERLLLDLYGFNHIKWLTPLGGFSSLNLQMLSRGSRWVVKGYKDLARMRVIELDELMCVLQAHRFRFAAPVRNRSESSYFQCNQTTYVVLPFIQGAILGGDELNRKALMGTAQFIAEFHRLAPFFSKDLHPDIRPQTLIQSFEIEKSALLKKSETIATSSKIAKFIRRSLDAKERFLDEGAKTLVNFEALEKSEDLIHGDFHNENILYNKIGDPICLLDFENFSFGHRISDLIHFIQIALCNRRYGSKEMAKSHFFLKTYSQIADLSKSQIDAGLRHSFLKIALSTFFEKKLLEVGNDRWMKFIERDLLKLHFYRQNAKTLHHALTVDIN